MLATLGMDLLRAHDRAGDDRRSRAQGEPHEPAASEAGEAIALLEGLAHPLHAFREHADQLALAQQALAVLLVRAHGPALREHGREEGQEREHVEGQHPALAARGMLVADGQVDHQPVPGQHAGVVGDDEGPTLAGDCGRPRRSRRATTSRTGTRRRAGWSAGTSGRTRTRPPLPNARRSRRRSTPRPARPVEPSAAGLEDARERDEKAFARLLARLARRPGRRAQARDFLFSARTRS